MTTPSKKRDSTAISPGEDVNNSKPPSKTSRLHEQFVNKDHYNRLSTVDEEIAKEAKKQQAKQKFTPKIYNNSSKTRSASQKGGTNPKTTSADTPTSSFTTPNPYSILNRENNEDEGQLSDSETESIQDKDSNNRITKK